MCIFGLLRFQSLYLEFSNLTLMTHLAFTGLGTEDQTIGRHVHLQTK